MKSLSSLERFEGLSVFGIKIIICFIIGASNYCTCTCLKSLVLSFCFILGQKRGHCPKEKKCPSRHCG